MCIRDRDSTYGTYDRPNAKNLSDFNTIIETGIIKRMLVISKLNGVIIDRYTAMKSSRGGNKLFKMHISSRYPSHL